MGRPTGKPKPGYRSAAERKRKGRAVESTPKAPKPAPRKGRTRRTK